MSTDRAIEAPTDHAIETLLAQRELEEVRVTDPQTGGQKGSKLARFSLIPWDVLTLIAEHFGRGARKYEDRNWERGYKWSLSYDALLRHLAADLESEEIDQETGSLHIVAVAWHAIVLCAFRIRRIGTDDRRKAPTGGKVSIEPGLMIEAARVQQARADFEAATQHVRNLTLGPDPESANQTPRHASSTKSGCALRAAATYFARKSGSRPYGDAFRHGGTKL